jgi:ribosomal protein S18 acetylase RimI-like enzyme
MVSAGMIDDNTARIFQLYVLPSFQKRGIGSKLMDAAIKHFDRTKKVVLEVEEGNRKGIAFYAKYGFKFPRKTLVKVGNEQIPCLVGELNVGGSQA